MRFLEQILAFRIGWGSSRPAVAGESVVIHVKQILLKQRCPFLSIGDKPAATQLFLVTIDLVKEPKQLRIARHVEERCEMNVPLVSVGVAFVNKYVVTVVNRPSENGVASRSKYWARFCIWIDSSDSVGRELKAPFRVLEIGRVVSEE